MPVAADTLPPWDVPSHVAARRKERVLAAAEPDDEVGDDDETNDDTDETVPNGGRGLNQDLGNPVVAGGDEHQRLLRAAQHWFEDAYDVDVSLTFQDGGRTRPDGVIRVTPSETWHLEAECATAEYPARILQNLRRAQHADGVIGCVFVTPREKAHRVRHILVDPVNRRGNDYRDDEGTYSYYIGTDGDPVTDIDQLRAARFRLYTVTENGDSFTGVAKRD